MHQLIGKLFSQGIINFMLAEDMEHWSLTEIFYNAMQGDAGIGTSAL
jgi:hypothetical protein